jgi:hypothetical protein
MFIFLLTVVIDLSTFRQLVAIRDLYRCRKANVDMNFLPK